MIINHNMNAMNAHRMMAGNTQASGKSMEKLSSGLRINRAGDDAAGLAISEKMRGQIRGLDQASRNGADAISMIQTAEGALNETHSILQRMRELSVQSANGSNTDADRGRIQDEVTQLTDEINRIGNTTEFNTQKLINGSKDLTEKVGAVKNASSLSKIGTGTDKFTVRAAATAGEMTGATLSGSTTIHSGTTGKYTLGKLNIGDGSGSLIKSANAPAGTANELTVSIHGVVRTFTFNDQAASDTVAISDMQTNIRTAFGRAATGAAESGAIYANAATITVSNVGGKIVIEDSTTGKGADSKVSIVGGNAANILSDSNDVKADGAAANNSLTVKYSTDGNPANEKTVTMTLADGTYNTPKDLADQIESKFNTAAGADATDLDFSAVAGGTAPIKVATDAAHIGKGTGITSITGSAAAYTGLTGPEAVNKLGQNANNKFDIVVDGQTYSGVEIAASDTEFTDKDILANAIQTAINNKITGADPKRELVSVKALNVADTDRVRFQVTSGKTGASSNITFGAVAGNDGMSSLGFNIDAAQGKDGTDASVSYQIGANKDQNLKLAFGDMRSEALGISKSGASATSTGNTVTKIDGSIADVAYGASSKIKNGSKDEYVIDVTTVDSANKAVDVINNAIEMVSKERSKLGANQNRLEHTIANLGTSSENLQSAESRIRDVDMAKEMMAFSKNNILSQASQAMLAQAKSQPEAVLQLLR